MVHAKIKGKARISSNHLWPLETPNIKSERPEILQKYLTKQKYQCCSSYNSRTDLLPCFYQKANSNKVAKNMGSKSEHDWVCISVLPFSNCMPRPKLFNLS